MRNTLEKTDNIIHLSAYRAERAMLERKQAEPMIVDTGGWYHARAISESRRDDEELKA